MLDLRKEKILLVVPPSPIWASSLVKVEASMEYADNSSLHLGLAYIASFLIAKGFNVCVYDARFDQTKPISFIAEKIAQSLPAVVAFSSTVNSYNNVVRISRILKEKMPQVKIVVGGPHVSAMINSHPLEKPISKEAMAFFGIHAHSTAEACLRGVIFDSLEFPKINGPQLVELVVVGDCFDWAPRLFKLVLKQNSKKPEVNYAKTKGIAFIDSKNKFRFTSHHSFEKNLSFLPFPARHLFPMANYLVKGALISSHGCPMLCSYCTCPSTANRKYIPGTPEYTVNEMLEINKKFGVVDFRFNDDAITLEKKWVEMFCDILIKQKSKGFDFRWSCFARVDQVSKEMIQKMVLAGCSTIQYGVETGSQSLLSSIKKGGTASVSQSIAAVNNAVKAGVDLVRAGFIVGFPEETKGTICESFDLIEKFYKIGGSRVEIGVASLTPYLGSLDGDRALQGFFENAESGIETFRPVHFNFDKYAFQEVNVVNPAFPTFKEMKNAYSVLFGATQELKAKYSAK